MDYMKKMEAIAKEQKENEYVTVRKMDWEALTAKLKVAEAREKVLGEALGDLVERTWYLKDAISLDARKAIRDGKKALQAIEKEPTK